MMGHTHALSGAVAWLAVAPVIPDHQLLGVYAMSLSPAQIAAGAVVCAGAAMLPDADHQSGTIANMYGPITRLLTKIVATVSGGHRHATHSLLFAIGAGAGSWALTVYAPKAWLGVLFLLIGFGLHGIGLQFEKKAEFSMLLNAVLAAGGVFLRHNLDMRWAGYAVALGCVAHVAGDCLTPEGCPVFWPIQWRMGIPLVPRTDGNVEKWLVTPILTLGGIILAIRTTLGDSLTHWLNKS